MKPLVSVIIPAYNAVAFISDAIESVLGQTYKNFEIIVIDDGSTDSTPRLLSKYKPTIKIFSINHSGPASARNVGIRNSSGKYIAFLDADDLWEKDKLLKQIMYMEKNSDLGFSYTYAICFSDCDGKKIYSKELRCNLEGNVFQNLFWSNFIVNSTVMVKRICLEKVGLLDESKDIIGSEDYDLWLRLSREYKLGLIPEILTEYRIHNKNLIGNSYNKAFNIHKRIYKKFYEEFKDTKERIGLNLKEALGDLILRYAYKNYVDRNWLQALQKSLQAIIFTPKNGIIGTWLIATSSNDITQWSKIISNFRLWQEIVITPW